MCQTWMLVVPVKPLSRAKSRLSGPAGPHRAELALAVAIDTVSAALRCSRVRGVLVVTDDPIAAAELAALGAHIVPDEPDSGLNPALVYGASRAASGDAVAALSADLPALRPAELDLALEADAGGLRLLRFGQRVNIAVADDHITCVTLSTLPLP